MTFLDRLAGQTASPHEASVTMGAAVLSYSGDLSELERRLISIFRDQFPPLSRLQETVFQQIVDRAMDVVRNQGAAQDARRFVQQYVAPAITTPQDRLAVYRYAYALAMANLNIDPAEQVMLDELKSGLGLDPASCRVAEGDVLNEFNALHRALAATTLGLIIVAADGQVQQAELDDLKAARTLLEPIARLDDTQFNLVYDMGISIYNRFLTDTNNRRIFLYNIVVPKLDTPEVRNQAFHYAASIATADGDVARAEIDTLKDVLTALQMDDATGEAIFAEFMARVKTIDGQAVQQ